MSIVRLLGIVGGGYEPEAVALFARMSTTPDAAHRFAINYAIRGLKSTGIWPKLDTLYVLAAADEQAARLNWVSTSYDLVKSGAALLSFVPDKGYVGNSVTGFSTAYFPSGNYQTNSHHMGAYVSEDGTATSSPILGATTQYIVPRFGATTAAGGDGPTLSGAVANGLGHTLLNRTASNAFALYRNGVSIASGSGSPAAASDRFHVLGNNPGTAGGINQQQRLAMAHWGGGLTPAQIAAASSIFAQYLAALA